jgi:hypothetical protein
LIGKIGFTDAQSVLGRYNELLAFIPAAFCQWFLNAAIAPLQERTDSSGAAPCVTHEGSFPEIRDRVTHLIVVFTGRPLRLVSSSARSR